MLRYYEYDKFDRQEIVEQSNGLTTKTVYNAKGQVEKTIVKSGSEERVTSYKYDEFGNISETTQPDGTKISAKYNEKGQKVSETNQLGQTRTFEYDDNGQLVKVTLPEINGQKPVYEYTYDAQGNQLTIKDPNGHITRFVYDINGNQTERILPDGSKETFEYDQKGRLLKETSFECVVTTYKYDAYDRLESKTFKTAAGETETWTYIYDEYGRVKEVHQGDRVTYTKYNEQGQVEYIETSEGRVSYTYDKFGRQTSVKTDNDTPTEYSYDNFGRLKIVKSDNQTTTYEYDAFGNLVKTTTDTEAKRLVTTYKYDNMNRLITLTNFVDVNEDGILNAGDARISQFDYKLDLLGRKEKATEVFGNGDTQTNIIDWTYDSAGRLIRESFNHYDDALDQAQEWEYDLVGNRTLQKLDIGIDDVWEMFTTYEYDENDRLINEIADDLTEANRDKVTKYGYDHTQQTSKIVSENGVLVSETTFEYDAQGKMAVVTIVAGNRKEITKYEYGADGIRTSAEYEIWEGGELKSKTRTEYLNDAKSITGYSQVLKQTETDIISGDESVTTYVIGHQRISQTVKSEMENVTHFFTFDGHGSTRVLLNAAYAVAQLYSFDAYGNSIGFNPAEALTEFLYSGEQFDSKIGQQYLRARYYDPATGRFNRLDQFFGNMSDPQSLHKYLYTHSDPVNGIDPSGLMFASAMSGLIGVGIHLGVQAVSITAITAGSTSALGGLYYWTQGQNVLAGMYNGGLIGASLSVAYVMSNATRNWNIMADVFSAGLSSGLARCITESVWGVLNKKDISTLIYETQFKVFDSVAISMWNAASNSIYPNERLPFILTIFDTIVSSVVLDINKKPPLSLTDIIGNAGMAVGIQLAQKFLIEEVKKTVAPNVDFDKIKSIVEYISTKTMVEFIAKGLISFDIKTITEIVKIVKDE